MQIGLFTQILLPKHFYIYFVVFVFFTAVVVVVAATCGKVFVVHILGACFMPSLRNRFPQAATKSGNLKDASLTLTFPNAPVVIPLLLLLLVVIVPSRLELTLGRAAFGVARSSADAQIMRFHVIILSPNDARLTWQLPDLSHEYNIYNI